MVMKTIARSSKVDGAPLSHVPGSWNELKAVALMLPHPRCFEGPISPHWIFQVASILDLDLSPKGSDHHLLPFVIALARAPLPAHWYPVPRESVTAKEVSYNPKWYQPAVGDDFVYPTTAKGGGGSVRQPLASAEPAPASVGAALASNALARKNSSGRASSESMMDAAPSSAAAPDVASAPAQDKEFGDEVFVLPPSPQMLDVYEHTITKERRYGHPGASAVIPIVRGMQQRALRSLKATPTDGWVQFSDNGGEGVSEVYFYNFRKKERVASFPKLSRVDVPRCVLPPRKLESSAGKIAASGEAFLPRGLSYTQSVAKAKELIWEPRKTARAIELAHQPCPLDEILMAAIYLGIDPVDHCDMMFLIDAMLTPEMPVGWLVLNCAGEGGQADEYYWNTLLGYAQWEHPQLSFLTGVATYLKGLHKKETDAADAEKAKADRLAAEEEAKREVMKAEAKKAAAAGNKKVTTR